MKKIFFFPIFFHHFLIFLPDHVSVRSYHQRCSIKKVAQRQISVLESPFNKVAGLQACNFIKRRLQRRCFPVNIAKFLRTPILKNNCERLLLDNIFQRLSSAFFCSVNLSILKAYFFCLPF